MKYPEGMDEYLSYYGWHFSKKMCDWAVSRMYRLVNDRPVPIDPISKERLDDILKRYSAKLTKDKGYDAVYVANMCKADYLGRSVKDEGSLVQFIIDTIEGTAMKVWYLQDSMLTALAQEHPLTGRI